MPILLETVSSHYDAIVVEAGGGDNSLKPIIKYDDAFLHAHEYRMDTMNETRTWWKDRVSKHLVGTSPNDIGMILNNKYKTAGPLKAVTQPAEQDIKLSIKSVQMLRDMCSQNGITLNCAVNFAWHKLLSMYTGDDQTIVGVTVSGREMVVDNIDSSVGMYINTLPLNVQWTTNTSSIDILHKIRDDLSDMTVYGAMPLLEVIREWNKSSGSSSSSSIDQPFQSVFVYENYPDADGKEELQKNSKFQLGEVIEKLDMPLGLTALEEKKNGHLKLTLMYNGEWLSKERATELLNQLERILDYISINPTSSHEFVASAAISKGELELVTGQRKIKVAAGKQQQQQQIPRLLLPQDDRKIYDLFQQQTILNPNGICVSYNDEHVSYLQLNRRSNELAMRIKQARNVQQAQSSSSQSKNNSFVALYMDKSVDMIVSIMGVLKANMAYVPISRQWPKDRIDFVLQDCQASIVVTHSQYVNQFNSDTTGSQAISVIDVADVTSPASCIEDVDNDTKYDDNTLGRHGDSNGEDEDLAYVIYTSGTTGK